MNLFKFIIVLLLLQVFLLSCSEEEKMEGESSSWEVIQQRILEPNCAVCHSEGTSFAKQSNLILTPDIAYSQLIDQPPTNTAAKKEGLDRVGTNGLSSLHNSFLWKKINAEDRGHFYNDHPEYGELMPLGTSSLTKGQLEYIKQWIIKGAPFEGFVADLELLKDTTRFELPEQNFIPLPLPVSGYQLHMGPFSVIPQFERELFEYQFLNNQEDIWVNRIEINLKSGSHHFILYDYPEQIALPEAGIYRDIRNENNQINWEVIGEMANQIFVFGTQLRNTDYKFPEGVSMKIPPNKGYDLNVHYLNYSENEIEGEVYVNLHTTIATNVKYEAKQLFLSNRNINLPAGIVTTLTKEFLFDEPRNVLMLTSHAHEHLEDFKIFIVGGDRDGELVYYSNDWEHPPLMNYDPPIELNVGEGLQAVATYNNTTDKTLRFGLLSIDEMMIIFGSYYN